MAVQNDNDIFSIFKNNVLNIDPVVFCENNLTIDGQPFRLNGSGYKPFADIYRYICLKAVQKDAKPVILVKGRQVGATTMAAALEAYFVACGLYGNHGRPAMRMMHLFPSLALAVAYTKDKLEPMISQSKPVPGAVKANGLNKSYIETFLDTSSPANNNMHFKKFIGGNQIWIESPGATGDRIRGRTIDCLFADEVQDYSSMAIGASTKVLTQAKHGASGEGIQVYFGTPKQKGGVYYKMWKSSNQQYYHLHCEECDQYFPLYHPSVNWEDVWLYHFTVRCTKCGHEQDKNAAAERGKWIGLEDDSNCKMVGYHINQLYIPHFPKELVVGQKPENHPSNSERIYMNEVLGEFYDASGGTISRQEILDYCAEQRKFTKSIGPEDEVRVYAGFDWGQKANWDTIAGKRQGQSYSCVVVITARGPRLLSIEFATRLLKNDPEDRKNIVEEMFRRYSVKQAVGDIGNADDLTHHLQQKYGEAFLASRAVAKVNGHVRYRDDMFPKEIQFERDYYISELFGLLREGAVKFPYAKEDMIDWLIDHCCSMDIKVTHDRSGEPIRRFVKGAAPNDGFMALLNAYLAWKWDVSQKFNIKNPAYMKYEIAKSNANLAPIIGYCPKL